MGESEFLPPQRGRMTKWDEEVEMEEPHTWAAPVASLPSALSLHPVAVHTGKSAPQAL